MHVLPNTPPPVVLLRATNPIPVPAGSKPGSLVDVDTDRESPLLGWDKLPGPLLREIYDIQGHHFDIFEERSRVSANGKAPFESPELTCRVYSWITSLSC